MKIAYLVTSKNDSSFHDLQIELMRKNPAIENLQIEFEKVVIEIAQFQEFLFNHLESYVAVRLSIEFQEIVTSLFPNLPTSERIVQVADFLFVEKKKWWPRSLMIDCLSQTIVQKQPQIDTQAHAIVVGDNSLAQISLFVLIKMGFSKIKVVSENSHKIQTILERFQQNLFGIEFKLVSPDELTLLPNICSVAVNTITAESGHSLINDLMYLNFLKSTGLLVDLSETEIQNPLIEEAKKVQIQTLHLSEIEIEIQKSFFQKLNSEL